ncbi:MAG: HAD family hydrolase [Verrucomicrobia bacterium]|nr:HAD family hydrolase [Verrucomicrobiota bacterium]
MIIFDLDDTLIDTSGAITPYKMKLCLQKLQEEGLSIGPFHEAYRELMQIDSGSYRSLESLKRFIETKGGDPSIAAGLKPLLTAPLPDHFSVPTTPHAKEILKEFGSRHKMALVTGGHPPFQREKLKKAGIEPSVFSKILIPEDSIKKPVYEALLREFLESPRDVFVCGDRIQMDLAPAYELGFKTVHMKWGRGLVNRTEPWIDYAISDLSELRKIVP